MIVFRFRFRALADDCEVELIDVVARDVQCDDRADELVIQKIRIHVSISSLKEAHRVLEISTAEAAYVRVFPNERVVGNNQVVSDKAGFWLLPYRFNPLR